MLYFTADLEFGSDKERLDRLFRPFKSAQDHDDYIIEKWNETVSKDDSVIVVGDFVYDNNKLKLAEKLNGHKHLLLGNHDDLPIEEYEKYFVTVGEDTLLNRDGLQLYLNHYPYNSKTEYWNICGHVGVWRFQKNTINVSVDMWNFYPVSMDQIKTAVYAIKNVYDIDCWAYHLTPNKAHEYRGKDDSYAQKLK